MAIDIVGEGNANIPSAMREFFYVDLERVRSYYAQANRGIIESIVTKDAKILSGDLKATIFGIGGSGSLSRTGSHDETRSLQELTYTLFEELLEERDLITDIGETFSDPKSWGDGVVHNTLREGQIIRFTGDIRVLDPQFFGNQVTHVLGLATALAGLQVGEIPGQPAIPPIRKGGATRASQGGKSPEQQRERIKRELVQGILGMSVAQIEEFCNLFSSFSHNVISMRAFPCGTSRPEFHFSGTLLSRTEYIQAEREELYSRYSNKLSNWTAVMQIARIPHEEQPAPDLDNISMVRDDERIDRVGTEGAFHKLLELFEYQGMSEGISFPTITVTPLALYREFE